MLISLQLLASELPEMGSTGDINRKLNNSFDFVLPRQDEKEEQPENNMLSDIERLVKGKKFTRYANTINCMLSADNTMFKNL